jgi:2-polyprenyl-6-methoxyphenol hydroxylase-like FAD-dependent oxidoreductase
MAMTTGYDAIVVGARCAGSPTAMLLARRGYRVLLMDRATFPSDTLSTHAIHAPGVAALRRWGLLDAITATGCPPLSTYRVDFGPFTVEGTPPPVEGISAGCAPRRYLLDTILVEAGAAAGVEVRERFSVHGLLVEDGAVVGIRGAEHGGREVVERARIVIGADGRNSSVARAVRAEEYATKPRLGYGYYTYWRDLPLDGFTAVSRPDRAWGAFPTNDGLTLVVVGWPYREAAAYKADVERNYLATLELAPWFADLVRGATRVEPFLGGAVPGYLRKPYGPGWALVGDAGYNKDPITAQGISDAFRDAELCATAVDEAVSGRQDVAEAMAAYQLTRDAHVLPIYEFTSQMATMAPPSPEVAQLLAVVAGDPQASDQFAGVIAGTVSPVEFFAPDNIGRILGAPAPAPAPA